MALLLATATAADATLNSGLAPDRAAGATHAAAPAPTRWVTTWGAGPQASSSSGAAARGFNDQTVRNVVFTSIGGSALRVRLSNAFGARPLQVGAVSVGQARDGPSAVVTAIHRVTFRGRRVVVIPPGRDVVSDPVAMRVQPLERLVVSLYLPRATGPPTLHALAREIGFIAKGDHALDSSAQAFTMRTSSWYFVDGIEARSSRRAAGAVVVLGDSITDGVGSPIDGNARWPNDLARRVDAVRGPPLAIVDEGIGGNRVLHSASCCGVAALARFRPDVLRQAGVTAVILLEGINDIGMSNSTSPSTAPHTDASAQQIITGYRQIIARAHEAGLEIFGGTLTPFRGARYWTPAGEAKREAVNRWIRTSGAFDGVLDFAAALADPAGPLTMDPAYDSGDHLHPNALGYQAMADAVRLKPLFHAR